MDRESQEIEDWKLLTLEIFDEQMRNDWGWGNELTPGRNTQSIVPNESSVTRIECGSLYEPYYSFSVIKINFGQQTITCHAVDQKSPAERTWNLTQSDKWWEKARSTAWPIESET